MNTIAAQLCESPVEAARITAGVPLLTLERRTGIPRSTLRRKIARPGTFTLSELVLVANVLEVDASSLFVDVTAAS